MIMMAGFELPLKAMRQQIASAVDLIVQANRLQGGPRKVTHITEVIGMEQDTIVMQDIYQYVQEGVDENGRAVGQFRGHRHAARRSWIDLESAGVRLPASAFRERIDVGGLRRLRSRFSCIHESCHRYSLSIAAFIGVAALVGGVGACCLRGGDEADVEDRLDVLTGAADRRRQGRRCNESSVLSQPLDDDAKAFWQSSSSRFRNLQPAVRAGRHARSRPRKFFVISRRHGRGWRCCCRRRRRARPASCPLYGSCPGVLAADVAVCCRRKRRLRKFATQLPDALELIARALRAGHSLASGFNLVADEMPAPIGDEFSRVLRRAEPRHPAGRSARQT